MADLQDYPISKSFADRQYSSSSQSSDDNTTTCSSTGDSVNELNDPSFPNRFHRQNEYGYEAQELPPGHVAERFKVDRKKLERMLQIQVQKDVDRCLLESGEDFFQRVMNETGTTITWPSRLKIGAKSKKDPHIKVTGKPERVASAKNKIMSTLDTKGNRVTLKMDVSFTEHSHIIGKGGNSIRSVMEATGCHIHFPDSNRCAQQEKSNQVSIAGQLAGAEQARAKIRELLPLVMFFEVPPSTAAGAPDMNSPSVQHVVQTCNVAVSIKQRNGGYSTTVTVRGSASNPHGVNEACVKLMEHLTGNPGVSLLVSTQIEIAPQHHQFMHAGGGFNISQIMQYTRTTIRFPDPATTLRKSSVFITGSVGSVIVARELLMGCLPLVLMFDVRDDTDISPASLTRTMEQFDVFLSVKPKPRQPSKSVIVKSAERNAANIYRARQKLLGKECDSFIMESCKNGVSSLPFSGVGMLPVVMHHSMPGVVLQPQTIRPLLLPPTGASEVQPITTPVNTPSIANISSTHQIASHPIMAPPRPSTSPATLVYTIPKNNPSPQPLPHTPTHMMNPLPQPPHTLSHMVNPLPQAPQPSHIPSHMVNQVPHPPNTPSHITMTTDGNHLAQLASHALCQTIAHQPPSSQISQNGTMQVTPRVDQVVMCRTAHDPEFHREVGTPDLPHSYHFQQTQNVLQRPVTITNGISPGQINLYSGSSALPANVSTPAMQGQVPYAGQSPVNVRPPPSCTSPYDESPYNMVPHPFPTGGMMPLSYSQSHINQEVQMRQQIPNDYRPDWGTPPTVNSCDAPLDHSSMLPSKAQAKPVGTDFPDSGIIRQSTMDLPNLTENGHLLGDGIPDMKPMDAPFMSNGADVTSVGQVGQALASPLHSTISGQVLPQDFDQQTSIRSPPSGGQPVVVPTSPPPGFTTPNPAMVSSQLAELQLSNGVNEEQSSAIERLLRRSSTNSESSSPDVSDVTHSPTLRANAVYRPSDNLSSRDISPDSSGSFSSSSSGQPSPGSSGHFSPTNSGHYSSNHRLRNSERSCREDGLYQNGAQLSTEDSLVKLLGGKFPSAMSPGSGMDPCGSDKRAPGWERAERHRGVNNQLGADPASRLDYKQKKLLAQRAMKNLPVTKEVRTPISTWSGLGFSKSMPDPKLRDLRRMNGFSTCLLSTIECEDEKRTNDNECRNQMNQHHPHRPEMNLSQSNYIDSTTLPRRVNDMWTQNGTKNPVKQELCELFVDLGLGKYTDVFQQQEIDLATFLTLTDSDLKELGISTFGARRRMLLAISDLNSNQQRNLKRPPSVGDQKSTGALGCREDGQFTAMGGTSPVSCW